MSSLSAVQATGAQTAWSVQEVRAPPAAAGAFVRKAWKETELVPARTGLEEQPAKPVLKTTYLGPAVQQCAAVCTECATVGERVTEAVNATLRTPAPTATSPFLNVQPCSALKIRDAHLPAKMKQNWNANAFPITEATATTASPSIHVYKQSAILMLIARTWDQIGTVAHARKATTGMAKCAYQ